MIVRRNNGESDFERYRTLSSLQTKAPIKLKQTPESAESSMILADRPPDAASFFLCLTGDPHPDNEDVAALGLSRRYVAGAAASLCLASASFPLIPWNVTRAVLVGSVDTAAASSSPVTSHDVAISCVVS